MIIACTILEYLKYHANQIEQHGTFQLYLFNMPKVQSTKPTSHLTLSPSLAGLSGSKSKESSTSCNKATSTYEYVATYALLLQSEIYHMKETSSIQATLENFPFWGLNGALI
jgi:hypothetical protein